MSSPVEYVAAMRAIIYQQFLFFLVSQSTFNGPFKRAELLLLPQYAASDAFLAAGKWTGAKDHILSVNGSDNLENTEPLYCIVIGTVSANKVYLGKHGNFSLKFGEEAQKAKLQFSVSRPNGPDFGADYDKGVLAFQEHQHNVSETHDHCYFLLKEESNAMLMNFALFKPKVSGSN